MKDSGRCDLEVVIQIGDAIATLEDNAAAFHYSDGTAW
jgi:hypothetical protein